VNEVSNSYLEESEFVGGQQLTISSDVLSSLTVLILFAGLVLGIWELRGLADEQSLVVFTKYTERYSDIVDNLPNAVYSSASVFDQPLDDEKREVVMKAMRRFFDLCSEEFYLNQEGRIKSKVWDLWKVGMKYHMSSKSFQDAWNIIKGEGYADEFGKFIVSPIEYKFVVRGRFSRFPFRR
jgi:hypothetical protein